MSALSDRSGRRMVPRLSLLLLLLLPLLASGCIMVPYPQHEKMLAESRRAFTEEELHVLRVGATRSEVLLALGEPDVRWKDDRVLLYAYTSTSMGVFVIAVGGSGGGAGFADVATRKYVVVCRFDRQGLLDRFEIKHYPIHIVEYGILEDLWREWGKDLP